MHRSSESIAALAAALAKAQMVLTNPEKSLTGTVPSSRYDELGRTFRYAPLSSGLDIVRKALGEQGIATLQTTTIDQDIQTVSLTTVLAHASGEWIASDWPVCALSDMAAPRRMGAALTYARRYALFTLVGIAGEDDLDAPELGGQPAEGTGKVGNGLDAERQKGHGMDQPLGHFAAGRKPWSPPKEALAPEKSAAVRDRLLVEVSALAFEEQATAWAQKSMGAKNTLTSGDSGVVEAAFAARLAELTERYGDNKSESHVDEHGPPEAEATAAEVGAAPATSSIPADPEASAAEFSSPRRVNCAATWHIDKGALALSEPRRYRDRAHLRFVSAQPCLICGRRPSDAHHLRFAQARALGRRVSDEYAVPLCRTHHRVLHRHGDEAAWWETNRIDPVAVSGELWQRTRLDGPSGGRVEALLSVGVIEPEPVSRSGLMHVTSDQPPQIPGPTGQ
jgi:ERF superfamily